MKRFLTAVMAVGCLGLGGAAVAPAVPAAACLYLPPSFADRVVFYDAFERGEDGPEINRIGATVSGAHDVVTDGFAGHGCRSPRQGETPLEIRSPALSPSRPLTVMRSFRLDRAMTETSSFQLVALLGKGHVSCFVHGKGEWCALQRPTMFVQIDGFPRIANVNQAVRDNAYFAPGAWHHVALTVANAADVRFYVDGQPVVTVQAKGRPFGPDDITTLQPAAEAGDAVNPPVTSDDLIVVDRVLSPGEIEQSWRSAQSLKRTGMPAVAAGAGRN